MTKKKVAGHSKGSREQNPVLCGGLSNPSVKVERTTGKGVKERKEGVYSKKDNRGEKNEEKNKIARL